MHVSFQLCARAHNYVVDDQEAHLAVAEALFLGQAPSDLRSLYCLLLLLCPNTPPRQLLIDYFMDLAANCVGAGQPANDWIRDENHLRTAFWHGQNDRELLAQVRASAST